MENSVSVTGIEYNRFASAMALALSDTCIGYEIKNNELFLYRYCGNDNKVIQKFPYEYNLKQTIDFAFGWWEKNKKPVEPEPDTDGSTEHAWELTTERSDWHHEPYGTFVSVKAIWFIYGK